METTLIKVSRRRFLLAGLSGSVGLTLGMAVPTLAKMGEAGPGLAGTDKPSALSAVTGKRYVKLPIRRA